MARQCPKSFWTGRILWAATIAAAAVFWPGNPARGEAEAVDENSSEAKTSHSLTLLDPKTKRTLGQLTKIEESLLKLTNQQRALHKKPPLKAVSHLNVIAQRHAINMAGQQKMAHELAGQSPLDRLKSVEYQFRAFGENVAAGYPNAKAAVEGWMKSPGHRGNILDQSHFGYQHVGLGAYKSAKGVWYYCQVFARPAPGTEYE